MGLIRWRFSPKEMHVERAQSGQPKREHPLSAPSHAGHNKSVFCFFGQTRLVGHFLSFALGQCHVCSSQTSTISVSQDIVGQFEIE